MAEEKWDIEIKPKDKLLSVDFHELWRYRDLCWLFVKRNIITQYKQTILGPIWFIVQPAMTVLMYMIVFGGIAGTVSAFSGARETLYGALATIIEFVTGFFA